MNGIETIYMGYLFRSRNEARWAALFQGLGWNWTYEPFDADGYIPDFVVVGPRAMLIEVKPDVDVGALAKYEARITCAVRGLWAGDILIVGSTAWPFTSELTWRGSYPAVGWLAEWWPDGWVGGVGLWCRCEMCNGEIRVSHSEASYAARPCGHHDGGNNLLELSRASLEGYWSTASNAVRWNPGVHRMRP